MLEYVVPSVFLATLAAVLLARRSYRRKRLAASPPTRIRAKIGVTAEFGCGHADRRRAVLDTGGALVERSIARPEAHLYNCHACRLKTGKEKCDP
jgi:hypothetical protein